MKNPDYDLLDLFDEDVQELQDAEVQEVQDDEQQEPEEIALVIPLINRFNKMRREQLEAENSELRARLARLEKSYLKMCRKAGYEPEYDGNKIVSAKKVHGLRGYKRPWQCKRVAMLDKGGKVIATFNSLSEAAKSIDRPPACVSNAIRKGHRCAGHYFRYADDQKA